MGTIENQLGIREWLESEGHEYIVRILRSLFDIEHASSPLLPSQVTDDKEGPNSVFQQHLKDAEILITTPFHPGYLTRDLISKVRPPVLAKWQ